MPDIDALNIIKVNIYSLGIEQTGDTGGSHLSRIFWEHENQSGLLVIQLIYIKLYRKRETKFWKKNPG